MRTALYMRMSTEKQENSIGSQQIVLDAYAKIHKMKIVEIYIDKGISGRIAEKRPAFMRMIDDSAKDLFDTVLVYDSSRFARNLEESIVYKSLLKKNNVKIVSATEPTLDDDSALITDAMLGALNEMYSRKLSKSVKRGMVYNAQKGKYQNPPPFGYFKSNGVMRINPDEAAIIRKLFELFIDCHSWYSVAKKMNELGIQKRNSYGWYGRDVKRMLHNQAYIGNVFYDGSIYKGEHEAIIDKKTWDEVQSIIEAKPKNKCRPSSTYKHWLSGLLKCANCGGAMNHTTDQNGNTAYRCARNSSGCCQHSNFMSVSKLEQLTKKALESVIDDDNLMEYDYLTSQKKDINELGSLNNALKKINLKLKRHKVAYSNGIDSLEEYKENKEKCKNEEDEILKQIKNYSENEITDEKIKLLKSSVYTLIDQLFCSNNTIEQKSTAIKNIIEKIHFNKYTGEFTVYYYL